jgi:hypothetical protein
MALPKYKQSYKNLELNALTYSLFHGYSYSFAMAAKFWGVHALNGGDTIRKTAFVVHS